MKNEIYLNAKNAMRDEAKKLKSQCNDKGYIRYELNNLSDFFIRQFNFYAIKGTITTNKSNLYAVWLSNYTASLHP
jgi:hypothetical protein